ncbi:MAG TPA: sel1 repeat family protein, partial [Chromatiales bacterium]|nr:sel1 repeat family protein [Chromatiales bacterium]
MKYRQTFIGITVLVLLGSLMAAPVLADECRARLRPLLLSSEHDQTQIDAVRAVCEREYAAGSADAGYQLALIDLGLDGWMPERATPLIREAADRGVAEARYWLAWQYEAGPILENDQASALYWYRAAAELDHRLA